MSDDHMLSFQDYGPSGAYPYRITGLCPKPAATACYHTYLPSRPSLAAEAAGFGPLPLAAAWAQTVLKGKHMIVRRSYYE